MSRRKPPHLRQRRNTPDLVVPDVAVPTPPLPEHPNPPTVWGPAAQRRWQSMWTSAVAPAFTDADQPLMVRLLRLEDEADKASALADAAPMVKGSTGQLRTNPMTKTLKDLRQEIRNLEDRLGLSPKGRLGLGLTVARTGAYTAASGPGSLAALNHQFLDRVDAGQTRRARRQRLGRHPRFATWDKATDDDLADVYANQPEVDAPIDIEPVEPEVVEDKPAAPFFIV